MTQLSVVIPCLNEADTLEDCIRRAQTAMESAGIDGEVVVADNASTDDSVALAEACGARVVHVEAKGYGNALMGGIEAARGSFVVMGDADGSYDFLEIPQFWARHEEGFELVQGCRLPAGGGTVAPGAMPFLHRWFGNPLFTFFARRWFRAPIHDIYCGLRGFTPELYRRLDQRCTGMEFAVEMIVKASLRGERIGEVPITLHPDKRRSHAPHLRTFRDGWRTLRFFLLFSPRALFLVPGLALIAIGLLGYALALPGTRLLGATLDAHTLLVASLAVLCGYQAILFAIFARTYAVATNLTPPSRTLERFYGVVTLERGLLACALGALGGLLLIGEAVRQWVAVDFGDLEYARTMRWVIPGVTLLALSAQTFFSSFFVSILGMSRK